MDNLAIPNDLEILLNTPVEHLPAGKHYVVGGAIFRESPSKEDPSTEPHLLVIKRAAAERAFPGNWETPGGSMEAGETIRQALYREVFEETGLVVEAVLYRLEQMYWTDPNSDYAMWERFSFVVKVRQPTDIKLDPEEHSAWQWVTEQAAEELTKTANQTKIWKEAFAWAKAEAL